MKKGKAVAGKAKPNKDIQTIIPVHPAFAEPTACTLTTKQKVRQCIYPAMETRYNYRPIGDGTKLKDGGIGLDDLMIRTDLYATVVIAIQTAGCVLREFSPDTIAQCKKAGDVTNAVWNDLIAP